MITFSITLVFFCAFPALFSLCSCTDKPLQRTVRVSIPSHPWEEFSGKTLWYSLKWTSGNEVKELYADIATREFSISIPLAETVYIVAYPLGEGTPFGAAITPQNSYDTVSLTQDEGVLCRILMNTEGDAKKYVNYRKILDVCTEKCAEYKGDFRRIDDVALTKHVLNGSIQKSSVKINTLYETGTQPVLNGIWVSESIHDELIEVHSGAFPSLQLSAGIHRYYSPETGREFRITVDYDGSVQTLLRVSLVP